MEGKTLSNFVDFSHVLVQNFNDVVVTGNELTLTYNNNKISLHIGGDAKIIERAISETYGPRELVSTKHRIELWDLRNLEVIDFDKQKQTKEYIDDLVFALYFNISLTKCSFEKAPEIHKKCSEGKYYRLIFAVD